MQIFQREVMHFTNNLEYYFKNSALKKCCQDLSEKLQGLHRPKMSPLSTNEKDESSEQNIDMDELIKLHKNF